MNLAEERVESVCMCVGLRGKQILGRRQKKRRGRGRRVENVREGTSTGRREAPGRPRVGVDGEKEMAHVNLLRVDYRQGLSVNLH